MNTVYISVSNGLLRGNHRKRMGTAVWEFMWLLDRMTSISEEGVGKVLYGKPIKLETIADGQVNKNTVSVNIAKLEETGYINTIRTSYGLIITVNKAQKIYKQKRKKKNSKNQDSEAKNDENSKNQDSERIQKTKIQNSKNQDSNITRHINKTYNKDTSYLTNQDLSEEKGKPSEEVKPSGTPPPDLARESSSLSEKRSPGLIPTPPASHNINDAQRYSMRLGHSGKPIQTFTATQRKIMTLNRQHPYLVALRKEFLHIMQIPKEDGYSELTNLKSWVKLYEELGKNEEKVKQLIQVAASDDFYRNNITSGRDLYAHRVKLLARVRAKKPNISYH